MTAPQLPSTVLLLTPEDDVGLSAVIRSGCGDCRIHQRSFDLTEWLREGAQANLAGVLVDTDQMSLGDLRVIAASLVSRAHVWLILLVGDRGLAGFEQLLDRAKTAALPKPWTPQGIAQAFRRIQANHSPPGAFPQEFLDGLVEGLRDPLTSISGYLQLLGNQGNENISALVSPALEAASQLSAQLEFLHLAAAELHPHPDSYDLKNIADELVQYAARAGLEVEVEVVSGLRIEADVRYLRAAMQSAFLLLQRFGSGGRLLLCVQQVDGHCEILWRQEPLAGAPQHPMPPPPYLQDLFQRLCRRIAAQAVVEVTHSNIPSVLGVRW